MHIEKNVSDTLVVGCKKLTTTNTTQLVATNYQPKKGMLVKAGLANTGNVFIGTLSISANVADAVCGFPLDAGQELFLAIEDNSIVRAKAETANDVVHYVIT
jgi:hypothetical protein